MPGSGGVDFGFVGEDNFGRRTARFCGLASATKFKGEWQGDDASRLRFNLEVDFHPPNFGSLVPGDPTLWEWRLTHKSEQGWWHVVTPYVKGTRVPSPTSHWSTGSRSYTIESDDVVVGDLVDIDLAYIALAREAEPGYDLRTQLHEEIEPDVWMVEKAELVNGHLGFSRMIEGARDSADTIHREDDIWYWIVSNTAMSSTDLGASTTKIVYATAMGPLPPIGSNRVWTVAATSPTVTASSHNAGERLRGWGFYHPWPYVQLKEQESTQWSVAAHLKMEPAAQHWVVILLLVAGRIAVPQCDCGGCDSTGPLKRCSRCKCARYCSPEHQKEAWDKHKSKCKKSATDAAVPTIPAGVWRFILSHLKEWHMIYYK